MNTYGVFIFVLSEILKNCSFSVFSVFLTGISSGFRTYLPVPGIKYQVPGMYVAYPYLPYLFHSTW